MVLVAIFDQPSPHGILSSVEYEGRPVYDVAIFKCSVAILKSAWLRLLGDNDVLSISVDYDVRVVRDNDDLSRLFEVHEPASDLVVDRLVVDIVLWLIYEQRNVCILVDYVLD